MLYSPFNDKRIKEHSLPFTKASRCLVEDAGIKSILGSKGYKFDGTSSLNKQEVVGAGETGYLDVQDVLGVVLLELIQTKRELNELKKFVENNL